MDVYVLKLGASCPLLVHPSGTLDWLTVVISVLQHKGKGEWSILCEVNDLSHTYRHTHTQCNQSKIAPGLTASIKHASKQPVLLTHGEFFIHRP